MTISGATNDATTRAVMDTLEVLNAELLKVLLDALVCIPSVVAVKGGIVDVELGVVALPANVRFKATAPMSPIAMSLLPMIGAVELSTLWYIIVNS